MSRRVLRVISYEGNPDWIERTLATSMLKEGKTFFAKQGTIKELFRVELREGEDATELLKPFNDRPL